MSKHKPTAHYEGPGEFFDTHAHLYDHKFSEAGRTAEDILTAAKTAGVTKVLVPADSVETSKLAEAFAETNDGIYGVDLYYSVGIHPHEAKTWNKDAEEYLSDKIREGCRGKLRAIGEIGLDYYYDLSPRDCKKEVFARQLDMAYEADMPIILHERDATKDTIDIILAQEAKGALRADPGVCHCCSMSAEAASELVKRGFYIGFDGPLTFKNNVKGVKLAQSVPLDRIVIETDSPYLTPEPNRGRRNEPEYVPFVAARLAEILGRSIEDIAKITYDNGCRLYGLG
ncbi:MAG: TatD family hydrolase [Clostridiales bacterium]|nr:TatD family hydrolase [Clostridiales bacterium]